MSDKVARRFIVYGRVQGVFFRRSAQMVALELGLSGWTRNRADGTVECFALGTTAEIEKFSAWLQHGPPQADVSQVEQHAAAIESLNGFDVR